jgi:hypothetical protein
MRSSGHKFQQVRKLVPMRRFLVLCVSLVVAVTASAQTLTCSSNDGHRRNCRAYTANGVRMVRQISGSACTAGYSWGYEADSIWVDHGCRAEFAVNVGARPQTSDNNSGGGHARFSPQDAMRSCQNTASGWLRNVPLAYVTTYRGSDEANGSYMINFHAQPPGGQNYSGFCIISKTGQTQNFKFDPGSGANPGAGNGGGQSFHDAMASCKNEVSSRRPNIPRAYIEVDQAHINGGSLLVNFWLRQPNSRTSTGYCDVFKNGRVNVVFNNR